MKLNLEQVNRTQKRVMFDFDQMPQAYLADNKIANKLRDKITAKRLVSESSVCPEKLSQVFYSPENIELINRQLVLTVFKKTNGIIKINFQSKEDLQVVMRWVYVNYARNLPFKIKEQITDLNNKVIKEILPKVLSEANQYLDYLRDIEKPVEPLPPPVNVSKDRTLPSISEIYHG